MGGGEGQGAREKGREGKNTFLKGRRSSDSGSWAS